MFGIKRNKELRAELKLKDKTIQELEQSIDYKNLEIQELEQIGIRAMKQNNKLNARLIKAKKEVVTDESTTSK